MVGFADTDKLKASIDKFRANFTANGEIPNKADELKGKLKKAFPRKSDSKVIGPDSAEANKFAADMTTELTDL